MTNTFGNRMIKIDGSIIGPRDLLKKTVKAKSINMYTHDPRRCIGCAQCALACDKLKAIEMEAVPG